MILRFFGTIVKLLALSLVIAIVPTYEMYQDAQKTYTNITYSTWYYQQREAYAQLARKEKSTIAEVSGQNGLSSDLFTQFMLKPIMKNRKPAFNQWGTT